MIGKTFKGLTDEMLRGQTARLTELAVSPGPTEGSEHVVHVRPELVVEVRFNDVQRSPRYPGGVALRFARVVRHREDKSPGEIEPLEGLVARLPQGSTHPAPRGARKAGATAARKQLSLFED